MKDYLMALYTRFCDTQKTDETFEKLCESLVGTFPDSRHLVLALKDQEATFCDDVAFAAFIVGFCLAGGDRRRAEGQEVFILRRGGENSSAIGRTGSLIKDAPCTTAYNR